MVQECTIVRRAMWLLSTPTSSDLNYVNANASNNPNTFADKNAINQKMYKLNAASNRTGLSRILKVMADDKITVLAKSYYLRQFNIPLQAAFAGRQLILDTQPIVDHRLYCFIE